MEIERVIETSDELIRLCARLPNPQLAAAALAVALGRVCGEPGVSLEGALELTRVAALPDVEATLPRIVTSLAAFGSAA